MGGVFREVEMFIGVLDTCEMFLIRSIIVSRDVVYDRTCQKCPSGKSAQGQYKIVDDSPRHGTGHQGFLPT